MHYSEQEAQLLYDSLPYIDHFTGKICAGPLSTDHKTKCLFKYQDYDITVQNSRHVYEIVNVDIALVACSRDLNNLLQCRSNVKKICHEVPLEEVPLYINDEPVKYIAAWRLRIAR